MDRDGDGERERNFRRCTRNDAFSLWIRLMAVGMNGMRCTHTHSEDCNNRGFVSGMCNGREQSKYLAKMTILFFCCFTHNGNSENTAISTPASKQNGTTKSHSNRTQRNCDLHANAQLTNRAF